MDQLQAISLPIIIFHCLLSPISFSIKALSNFGHTTIFFCVCSSMAASYNVKIVFTSSNEEFFISNFLFIPGVNSIVQFLYQQMIRHNMFLLPPLQAGTSRNTRKFECQL